MIVRVYLSPIISRYFQPYFSSCAATSRTVRPLLPVPVPIPVPVCPSVQSTEYRQTRQDTKRGSDGDGEGTTDPQGAVVE